MSADNADSRTANHVRILERGLKSAPEILLAPRDCRETAIARARTQGTVEQHHLQMVQPQLLGNRGRRFDQWILKFNSSKTCCRRSPEALQKRQLGKKGRQI